ncbi:MAG: conserved rane protein of unknown function [Actinomycetia bacterium]|nr:conserved rane protein of unknown function [Actinomycetes bacterium]
MPKTPTDPLPESSQSGVQHDEHPNYRDGDRRCGWLRLDPVPDRERWEQRHPPRPRRIDLPRLVGLATVGFTAIYFLSDLIEVAQGNFSTDRLALTYAGEAAIPLFVLGLYAVQRPQISRLGLVGAIAYAYCYVFFTSTVVYALVAGTPNYKDLTRIFGAWMTVHGVLLLLGGLAFGLAVARANVLPRWTGVCLMAGVVLVVAASGQSNLARTVAAAVPACAFLGMGIALLHRPDTKETP